MRIRSITFFIDPAFPLDEQKLKIAQAFLGFAQPAFSSAGYEVQSCRLATVPFSSFLSPINAHSLADLAQNLESIATGLGYAYVSLGPALPDRSESYLAIPAALAVTQNVFFSGLITTSPNRISLPAIRQCAEVIQRSSEVSANGFANLRFAALANVLPGSPFFPAAYHAGGEPSFALATEAADLAVSAFSHAESLSEAQENLTHGIEEHARALASIAHQVQAQSGVKFGGIDFSLAPFPTPELSIGTAMEHLGVSQVGMHGSLTAAAILTDAIDRANFQRAGFCGLFLPLLEDATLAKRATEGTLDLMDLLLYCAVCGTGLDTVPLPGDTSVEQLSAILLDLASLSTRLAKPLTARLMPIPGKRAGDPTGFDFYYFANSRVLPVRAQPLHNLFLGTESFTIHKKA